jgi:hypothetical protein
VAETLAAARSGGGAIDHGMQGEPSDGLKRLSLPDTCPVRGSCWSFRSSSRYGRRSVKPSALIQSNEDLAAQAPRDSMTSSPSVVCLEEVSAGPTAVLVAQDDRAADRGRDLVAGPDV